MDLLIQLQRRASRLRGATGFTLIELLVVIAVIAILMGLLMVGFTAAGKQKYKSRIEAQRMEIETAIEEYHSKRGAYPPSNKDRLDRPALYYELVGAYANVAKGAYETLDGRESIPFDTAKQVFSTDGFANAALKPKSGDIAKSGDAQNFYSNLKPTGISQVTDSGKTFTLLSVPVKSDRGLYLYWNYNSVNPTNNPDRYDLWVEWVEKGNTTILGNFKK